MADATIMTPEFAEQVAQVVRQVLRREQGELMTPNRYKPHQSQVSVWAICNTAIAAPGNGVTTPTSGTIEYLRVDSSDNLVRTGETATLTNRWEGIELEADTLIRVMSEVDEIILVAADCEALGSPPA